MYGILFEIIIRSNIEGYKLLIPCTTPPEAQCHQNDRGSLPSLALHPAGRGDEGFLQKVDNGEGKSKYTHEAPDHAQDRHRGCLLTRSKHFTFTL